MRFIIKTTFLNVDIKFVKDDIREERRDDSTLGDTEFGSDERFLFIMEFDVSGAYKLSVEVEEALSGEMLR